jgi:hypothetical protein
MHGMKLNEETEDFRQTETPLVNGRFNERLFVLRSPDVLWICTSGQDGLKICDRRLP